MTMAAGRVIQNDQPKFSASTAAVTAPMAYKPTWPIVTCPQKPLTMFRPTVSRIKIQIRFAR